MSSSTSVTRPAPPNLSLLPGGTATGGRPAPPNLGGASNGNRPAPPNLNGSDGASDASSIGTIQVTDPSMADMKDMSPDALAAFLKTELSANDKQITDIETQMESQNDLSDDLNDLSNSLSQYPQGVTNVNPPANGATYLSPAQIQQFRNTNDAKFQKAITDAGGPNTPEGQQISDMQKSFDKGFGTNGNTVNGGNGGTKGNDDMWSPTDISTMQQSIKNTQQSVNTQSQMNLINLQSLMSQRQTYIQIATNMTQSENDGTKSIADNVGK